VEVDLVVIVSLLSAALYGSGDFCGALATRRATIVQVVAGAHLVGLAGVTALALAVAERCSGRDLLLGACGGILGAVAVGVLYRRLAVGPMSVVAPLTAVTAAIVPTLWGALHGDRLSTMAWAGVALALAAVALVSSAPQRGQVAPVTPAVVAESLVAGLGFGGFFLFLAATDSATQPWPVVGARLVTTILLSGYLLLSGQRLVPTGRPAVGLIAATGLLDVGANVGFLYAANRGQLAVAAVLTSLYPVATVLLARLTLAERIGRIQQLGVLGALAATGLIAAG
jgi:uncharacterized membrane protein